MQNANWKIMAVMAMLGFNRGLFEDYLLTKFVSDTAVAERNGTPTWFWVALVVLIPTAVSLFLVVENKLQIPTLRWLVCNFGFAHEGGYGCGALLHGWWAQNFSATMCGVAALSAAWVIWFFVWRYPMTAWDPQRRFKWL